ncbi:hypothetical protein GZ77_01930 [Endozoicomonas montiporae]|uniref:SGNH hydrolase-type esterase domain-containing protein n=2 Tax=Endozoicomonas montiporae TaxID=1027273 RepID=A0A081NAF8_9GAMM|nr:SGNH/GDSL hydrolase family protein [Endozoicomonas montiporae]KEQ15431.1 hypothetical protein GZ77_01930 [Endozoicomonas montiporae]
MAVLMIAGSNAYSLSPETSDQPSIAFVGASFTAGKGNDLDFHTTMSDYFKKLHYNQPLQIHNFSPNGSFNPVFAALALMDIIDKPVESLSQQITEAAKKNPQFIISIDGLFWVAYHSEKDVMQRLEKALAFLSESKQNYVLALLPHTTVTSLIADYTLEPSTVAKANKRLKEWALEQNSKGQAKSKILLLDLNQYFTHTKTFNCGVELGKKTKKSITSKDGLHPNESGYLCLTSRLLDELFNSDMKLFNDIASYLDRSKLQRFNQAHSEL